MEPVLTTVILSVLAVVVRVIYGLLRRPGARNTPVDSLRRHFSYRAWERRLRKAGVPEEQIRRILVEAAKKDLK